MFLVGSAEFKPALWGFAFFGGFEGKFGGEDEGVVVRFEVGPVVSLAVFAAVLPPVAG